MYSHLPQLASITELKHQHLAVLAKLQQGPVVLSSRNQPVGVLLSPSQWEELLTRIEDQADVISALTLELQVERGETELEDADIDILKQMSQRSSIHNGTTHALPA